jgi:hypothetical protein
MMIGFMVVPSLKDHDSFSQQLLLDVPLPLPVCVPVPELIESSTGTEEPKGSLLSLKNLMGGFKIGLCQLE